MIAQPTLNLATVRADFPILKRTVNGHPLVYFDNAATTQKPQAVIDALTNYYQSTNANIHRGLHTLAEEATTAYESVRHKVATLINAPDPRSVIFTRNTTESLNLLAYSWTQRLQPGDEILLTMMEHHSNLVPWQLLAQRSGARLVFLDVNEAGEIDLAQAKERIGPRTKVVAIVHMSNVLGTINPIAELAHLAHAAGAVFIVDGAQSVPHLPVDVQALDIDFLAFSSHKMLGPTGVGVLYGRRELLEEMEPFLSGGEMISTVTPEKSTWAALPHKFEAGTPNIADVIAFGAALDYLQTLGLETLRAHAAELTAYAMTRMQELEGLMIYGPPAPERRGSVVSFNYLDIHAHDISTIVDQRGVALRAGHHCAQPLMRTLGVPATARVSFYVYNTPDEVDRFIEALQEAAAIFGHRDGA